MTCSHVLDLIDAGPFVDVTPAALEALHAHARTCATCAVAVQAAVSLSRDLAALPAIDAPPALAQMIDARLLAIAAAEQPVHKTSAETPDWRAWLTLSGAGAAMAMLIPSYAMTPDLEQLVRASEPAFMLEARAISMAMLIASVTGFLILLFRPVASETLLTRKS